MVKGCYSPRFFFHEKGFAWRLILLLIYKLNLKMLASKICSWCSHDGELKAWTYLRRKRFYPRTWAKRNCFHIYFCLFLKKKLTYVIMTNEVREFYLSVYGTWLRSQLGPDRSGTARPEIGHAFAKLITFLFLHRISWNSAYR